MSESPALPLAAEVDAWLARRRGLARSSREGYRSNLRAYVRFLTVRGIHQWCDVGPDELSAYVRSLGRRGLAPSNVAGQVRRLNTFHNFLRYRRGGPVCVLAPNQMLPLPETKDRLDEEAHRWLETLGDRGRRSTTTFLYGHSLRRLAESARARGATSWRDVGPATIAAHFQALEQAASRKTVHEDRRVARLFFEHLSRRGLPMRAAIEWLGAPKVRSRKGPTAFESPLAAGIDRFLGYCRSTRRLSEKTCGSYAYILRDFARFVEASGATSWARVPASEVTQYLGSLHPRGLSATSARHSHSTIRSFFDYLAGLCERADDWRRVGPAPKLPHRIPNVLTVKEATRLLDSIQGTRPLDLRDRAMLELAYATGCRSAELLTLRIEALSLEDSSVRVIGKGDRERLVPFGRFALRALEAYLADGRPRLVENARERAVFLNRDGRPLTRMGFGVILKQRAWNAGIRRRVYPHLLRHSCATHVLLGGANLRAVQELLGHASITSTTIYTHLDTRHLHETIEKYHPRSGMSVGHVKPGR